jgi:hypothetical protein
MQMIAFGRARFGEELARRPGDEKARRFAQAALSVTWAFEKETRAAQAPEQEARLAGLESALRHLVAVYDGHQDYRKEFRVR